MIQKLRRKFILILMSVVTLILLAVFVSMLLSTSNNTQRMSENMLRQTLNMQSRPQGLPPPQDQGGQNPIGEVSPNARTPVMVAEIGADGTISFLTNQLIFFEESEAKSAVQAAMSTGETSGILRGYELRFQKSDNGARIAFADISMERTMTRSLIINSLMIGIAALAVFFFVSIFLSRWAVHPVELAWKKQRQFVADASHELKTPLTVIFSNAEMLSAPGTFTDEKKSRRMEHILAEAALMKKLVDNLLTLARTDSTKGTMVRERVDFSFLMTSTILAFEPLVFDDRKKLTYGVKDNIFIAGDAQRLQQLLSILLDNAIKYCPSEGLITINLNELDKKNALLTVFNDGEPIPKEEIAQIFQRFYRIDQSRSAHGSFGLGLAIADSIVREHRGRIWVESGDKNGNSFFVTLPLLHSMPPGN